MSDKPPRITAQDVISQLDDEATKKWLTQFNTKFEAQLSEITALNQVIEDLAGFIGTVVAAHIRKQPERVSELLDAFVREKVKIMPSTSGKVH